MRATLGEALALLGEHLYLFTLLSLTVWLPVHVLVNYLEFFGDGAPEPGRSFAVGLLAQATLDPLAASAMLMALARIKHGLPLDYWTLLADGARAWSRLVPVRFVLITALVLPAVVARQLQPGSGAVAGLLLLVVTLGAVAFLLCFALAESVVVLEGRTLLTCWGRAAALATGRRRLIFGTAAVVFGLLSAVAVLATVTLRADPALNHFVVRTLFDCALSVSQTLFTIALFVVYWRAAQAPVPR